MDGSMDHLIQDHCECSIVLGDMWCLHADSGKGKIGGGGMHKPFRKGLSFFDQTPHFSLFPPWARTCTWMSPTTNMKKRYSITCQKSTPLQVAYFKIDHACHSRSRTRNGTRDHWTSCFWACRDIYSGKYFIYSDSLLLDVSNTMWI